HYTLHFVCFLFYVLFFPSSSIFFFFFNDTPTTEIYTLSLHDALPILMVTHVNLRVPLAARAGHRKHEHRRRVVRPGRRAGRTTRSEEHTSELQSLAYLVCRLLLEKKKKKQKN